MSKSQFLPKLTQREREILPFLLEGVSRKKIAHDLGISTETVKNHIRNTRKKFEDCTVSETGNAMVLYQMYYGVGGAGQGLIDII